MDLPAILMNALWAGLFAAGLAVIFTAPVRYLLGALVCGFVGSATKGFATVWGFGVNGATMAAAMALVLVAVAITGRREVPPVVVVSAIIPLGAAVAMFNVIFLLLRIPAASGDVLNAYAVDLSGNVAKVFATSLSIVLGLGAGMGIVRLFKRNEAAAA